MRLCRHSLGLIEYPSELADCHSTNCVRWPDRPTPEAIQDELLQVCRLGLQDPVKETRQPVPPLAPRGVPMHRVTSRSTPLTIAAALGALALWACSDNTTSPTLRSANAPSLIVGPTANVGPVQRTFASSAATQFCSGSTLIHTYTVPASVAPIAGCGTAFDLMTNLGVYNPGWSAP